METDSSIQIGPFEKTNKKFFPDFVRPYYGSDPIVAVKGSGVRLWDEAGASYLDLYSGVSTLCLGHCNPEVDIAFAEQSRKLGHLSWNYLTRSVMDYASRLLESSRMDRVFFVNSGSEAVDLALSLGMAYSGRDKFMAFEKAYHGGTRLAKEATGLGGWRFPGQVSQHCMRLVAPECGKCPDPCSLVPGPEDPICLRGLKNSLDGPGGAGILILEPVFGVGGIMVPEPSFFKGVNRLMKKSGCLLIVDEVQTGFGRCGGSLFGYQKFGLEPDIVCLGKGIANGYPLGAVLMSSKFDTLCGTFLHFNTFGGNPACIAAAAKVHDILIRDSILERVEEKGFGILSEMRAIFSDLPWIVDVRGVGYMLGLEAISGEAAAKLHSIARQLGVLVGLGGSNREVVRIQPSLLTNDDEWKEGMEVLKRAAARVA